MAYTVSGGYSDGSYINISSRIKGSNNSAFPITVELTCTKMYRPDSGSDEYAEVRPREFTINKLGNTSVETLAAILKSNSGMMDIYVWYSNISLVLTISGYGSPTTPAISVPAAIAMYDTPEISWGQSTSPENCPVSYDLQRSFNGGAYASVYSGEETAFTDSAVPRGNTTVRYRVRAAVIVNGEEKAGSGWSTSSLIDIDTSEPPTITGEDGSLGEYAGEGPDYAYTVDDANGGEVTVTVIFDGAVMRTGQAALGEQDTVAFTDAEWIEILNGSHTIKIIAKNESNLQAARTLTFVKNVDTIDLCAPVAPLAADGRPSQVLVNVLGALPTGSVLQVLACNNGNDAEPEWEDCTYEVLQKRPYNFLNGAKAAGGWGVKLRVRLRRGDALGGVYITSIGGNFR